MVQQQTVERCHYLQLGLLIMLGPFKVSLSISERWGRQRSVNDGPEPFVFERQDHHLAPLRVVGTAVVKWL